MPQLRWVRRGRIAVTFTRLPLVGVLLALGCSPRPETPPAEVETSAQALADVPNVLGFETAGSWSAAGGALSFVTSPKSEGTRAARLASFTDARLTSLELATDAPPLAEMLLDLHISGPTPPGGWSASVALSVFAPSRGLEAGVVLATRTVNTLPRGSFQTLRFPVGEPVREMLAEGATDLFFVVHARSSVNTQVFGFDRLRALAAKPAAVLPWWMDYCVDATCGGRPPVVLHVCPNSAPSCTPARSTTAIPQVDGREVNGLGLYMNLPDGYQMRAVSGPWDGSVAHSNRIIVKSDVDVTFTYYKQPAVWGGTTRLNFVSLTITSSSLVSTVFRHPSYLLGDEVLDLDRWGRERAVEQSSLAEIVTQPGLLRASFVPAELVLSGEGNYSTGGNWITINYGNPPYIDQKGGIYYTAMPRYAHEHTHEMFDEIRAAFPGNNSCLNEGIADAFPYAAGFLPEEDFGPGGHGGDIDFNRGCDHVMAFPSLHDRGNCPLWQVKRLDKLDRSFARGLLHPQHVIAFDSCDLRASRTGNAYVVLFTEAAGGVDMTEAVNMAQIPNAGSYAAAKAALGL